MASLGELFIELAFEGDTEGAEKFKKKVEEVIKECDKAISKNTKLQDSAKKTSDEHKKGASNVAQFAKGLTGFVAAATGAIYALQRLTDSLVKDNQAWINLTRTSDIALETFQKWGSVGKLLGVDDAAQSLAALNDRLFELRLTGQGADGFMWAGINPTNAEDVLEQLRTRVSGMSDTSASFLLKKMGLDPSMLHLLRMSRAEFEGLNNELKKYRLTPQQRKDIQMFNVQIQIASQKLQYLRQRVILALMPAWIRFLDSFARVSEAITKVIIGLNSVSDGVKAVASAITVILIPALTALMRHPVIATITAIIGALYLIIDDIVGFFQGKDSVTGLIFNFLDKLNEKLNSIKTPKWIKAIGAIPEKVGAGNSGDVVKTVEAVGNPDFMKLMKLFMQNALPMGMSMLPGFQQHQAFATPAIRDNINNTDNSQKIATINQYNTISTSETAQSVERGLDLLQANYVMSV